jgi:outer membrane PBP1 activator LpoA protein
MPMQASTTTRRLAAVAALAAWLAACQPTTAVRPDASRNAERQAVELAARGEHGAAALAWEQAAAAAPEGQGGRAWIAAAREWIAAGDEAAARRALERAIEPLAPAESRERARLQAELALLAGDPGRALELLEQRGGPEDAALLTTRARAMFALGDVPGAVRTLTARGNLLTRADDRLANQRMILEGMSAAGGRGADLRPAPGTDPLMAGWLELGRIEADARLSAAGTGPRLRAWRARYPAHPANAVLWQEMLDRYATSIEPSSGVALLLPLSGGAGVTGAAVRDGFLAAYYDQPQGLRPEVRVYDVAQTDAASAYLAALTEGAQIVVGPLTRPEVANVAAMADGRATLLALNFLPDGTITPSRFYQFAISPEDEARQVARRSIADGRQRGVALAPANDWGQRVLAAFADEFTAAGGVLVQSDVYAPGTTDFQVILRRLLQIRPAPPDPELAPEDQREPRYVYRDDADFIFVAAQSVTGRLIRTQLRFNYASRLPVYATSDIFDPGSRGSPDLEGIVFPDMPWVLDEAGPAALLRDSMAQTWPERAPARSRLYAFGYDAYTIVAELARRTTPFATPVAGLTGRLVLDPYGRILRELDFAQLRGGHTVPAPTAEEIAAAAMEAADSTPR